MKKFLILFLGFIILMAGCSSGSDSEETKTSENQEIVEEVGKEAQETEIEKEKTIEFNEIVVVDNDECTIKITGIEEENIWGYTLKAYLENKSSEKTYMFSVDNASINGVKFDPFFAAEVAAGKKSNEEINFSDSAIEEENIGEYTDIELIFRVYDSNDWQATDVANETIHVYPFGEENAVLFQRESKPTDNIIVDNENVSVTITGYTEDDIWGYSVNMFLVNKTDTEVMFSVDEASVNGYMADPFWAFSILPGKCAFTSMSWSDTTFEENGITDVEEIEFLLKAYDESNWGADDFVNEIIILQP